jgi:tetratricopeptide (TPR) repeat protein/2-polyprenyl-3-methyl-5-hydroxy-6-metoxy-1,4-benzoquinol methylase
VGAVNVGASLDLEAIFAQAVEDHQAGRLSEAVARYAQVLALKPDLTAAHINLGNAFSEQGKLEEAENSYRRALSLRPDLADAHNNLGTILFERDQLDAALECYHRAIGLDPEYADAYNNLGIALHQKGRLEAAESSIRKGLSLNPGVAEAHDSLGTVLWEQGRLEDALASASQAVALAPHCTRALNNFGAILKDLGRLDEALGVYRRLLQIEPKSTGALNGLAEALAASGDAVRALDTIIRSLNIAASTKAKRIFVDIVKSRSWTSDNAQLRAVMIRALAEAWERPSELAHTSASLIKHCVQTGACVARAAHAWPRHLPASELFGIGGLAALAEDGLLCTMLVSANNADADIERFLTMARRALLEAGINNDAGSTGLPFYAALANQCFLNDYVFIYDEDEIRRAENLRDILVGALQAGRTIAPIQLLAVAAYFPLHSLPGAARLLEEAWDEPVTAVMMQQVREPQEEAGIRATIPRLTPIEREVSRRVRNQYEENPYPRWVRIPQIEKASTISGYLCRKFPFASFQRQSSYEIAEILCACCGAGQMALEIAQSLKGRILGVDLSLKSLGYAKRKALELGISSIEFAQADVMELSALGRSFDLVECSGALHYFADPFAGWRVLLSLLRPGGYMLLGLYSKIARRGVMAMRERIAQWDYGSSPDDIRRCRQDLRDLDKMPDLGILNTYDFFGVSTCRDLLFHVQEQQIELGAIAAFLRENGLTFLGFETDNATLEAYRRRFPDDAAATNLDHWQTFENDNPETFSRMYMFWIQKAAPP